MQGLKEEITNTDPSLVIKSFSKVYRYGVNSRIKYWLWGTLILIILILLLPWTQNIRAVGDITTLRQEQRPQEINSIIAGRIIKWYIKEGDVVKKGDTLAQLAEVKDAYLDPNLIDRTKEQLDAKSDAVNSYRDKVDAQGLQLNAIQLSRDLKISYLKNIIMQVRLKIVSDSMEAIAANNDLNIATEQLRRQKIMRDSGLASLVQVEQRNQSFQNAFAKKTAADIKFTNTKTDLINASIELNQVLQEYAEKVYKTTGDIATAQSEIAAGKGEIAKLSNQYSNYVIRAGQYFLIAPQDGQIVQATKSGINEIVKEGDKLVEIVPTKIEYAVEMFVRPVDMPLMNKGQKVRFLFDGFPAIVFSGWPKTSFGTFGGRVVAIENSVSSNGKFRVLVGEDPEDKPWPISLKMGAGASGIALLKDVQIWYELWRNINGFPPDFYTEKDIKDKDEKK
jgi:multidrug resistance efflux pump